MLSIPFKNHARFDMLDAAGNISRCPRSGPRIFFISPASLAAKRVVRRGCARRWLISVWWICMRERQPTQPTRTHGRHPLRYNNAANPLRIARFNPAIALSISLPRCASARRILRLLRELYNNAFSGRNFCYGTTPTDGHPLWFTRTSYIYTYVHRLKLHGEFC